jgi:hypothetical protein
MLRTMELILGLPPMSQYDAAAIPMFNAFTNQADLTTYAHRPARVDLNEINAPNASGAQKSARWEFAPLTDCQMTSLNSMSDTITLGRPRLWSCSASGTRSGKRLAGLDHSGHRRRSRR